MGSDIKKFVNPKFLNSIDVVLMRDVNPGPKWGHCPARYRAMAAGLACALARVALIRLTRAKAHWPKASFVGPRIVEVRRGLRGSGGA